MTQQEPVAYRYNMPVEDGHWVWNYCTYPDNKDDPRCEPLYTTPQQRTWVGLTDEEIDDLHSAIKVRLMGTFDTKDIYRVIEAKLKEKNT